MLIYLPPSEKLLPALEAYRAECAADGETPDGAAGICNFPDLRDWLRRALLLVSPEAEKRGWIRTEIYFAAEMPEGCSLAARARSEGTFLPQPVGTFNVRIPGEVPEDGPDPLRHAGHIGYHVRPSLRGKGYGKALLTHATGLCRSRGIVRPFLCVEERNIPSLRTAADCGYVPEEKETLPDGTVMIRLRFFGAD